MVGSLWNILCVLLGLGLVIFFHELGHFAVAKWCDVHVERFSIGFGPILWSRQKGETEYALSAVPFGGYVKMLGQDDMDASQMANEDIAENPRSYSSKKVWQRMAIISAGVIMNILTAGLFYTLAYGMGVYEPPPTVGAVLVGSPSWEQGLRLGDEITHINGEEMRSFVDVSMKVALSKKNSAVHIKGRRANGTLFEAKISPDEGGTIRQIGIFQVDNNHIIQPLDKDGTVTNPGLPASSASPPFLPGDTIVSINGNKTDDYATIKRVLSEEREAPAVFELRRLGTEDQPGETVSTTVQPMKFRSLGFYMEIDPIAAIQSGSPAAIAGLQVGDTILSVNGKQVGTEIDPLQLPDYFASLADTAVEVVVRRKVKGSGDDNVTLHITPNSNRGWKQSPGTLTEPFAADAIGAAYHVSRRIAFVKPGSEAERLEIKAGQKIMKLELLAKDGTNDVLELEPKDKSPVNWSGAFWNCQILPGRDIVVHLKSGDQTFAKTLRENETEDAMYLPIRGFKTEDLRKIQKAESMGEAFSMGFGRTWKNVLQIYLTLRGLFTGTISVKEMQGPLGIANVAYKVAEQGFSEMMVFLGFLSVNLAVLNFLPIPVLDGGHMVFLTYEAVAGKKPSEKVLIAAQYVGLIMILTLMVFVLGQDVYRLVT